jgi:SsrA-binding protein
MARTATDSRRIVAQNRKARHNYLIEKTIEAGIMLTGTEVKSLRLGRASIGESYATDEDGAIYLLNAHIPEYAPAGKFNHPPTRKRKLLLHKKEIRAFIGATTREGYTLVPLSIYFDTKGRVKVELGLARGKKKHDKRASEKERDWRRQKERLLRA